ncbi:outer membrane protein [Microvirga rosea]|uniref:outer membrane protein n=1 Tax=Microvirga rosea TaxID=2715425 RepID=UPI001D0A9E54|nr:outer membrane beta-barrel protein [Microvirga rosea]MCB8821583.1 outer membrane beta-barrel protein [Microvirga rosea]
MKKFLLASVALFGFAGAASAADLPARAAPPAPIVAAVPIFTWTGFYVGVNAGYGWNTNNNDPFFYDPLVGYYGGDSGSDGGFVGGGQVGYNYQIGQFVIGVEGDVQFADRGGSNRLLYSPTIGYYYGGNDSDDWFGTVRARAGFAFDRALIYATGGFAFNGDNGGWALGGGLEYAFTNNLTAKIEGLYVNIDTGNNNSIYGLGYYGGGRNKDEFGVVRAGLNYKFSTY